MRPAALSKPSWKAIRPKNFLRTKPPFDFLIYTKLSARPKKGICRHDRGKGRITKARVTTGLSEPDGNSSEPGNYVSLSAMARFFNAFMYANPYACSG